MHPQWNIPVTLATTGSQSSAISIKISGSLPSWWDGSSWTFISALGVLVFPYIYYSCVLCSLTQGTWVWASSGRWWRTGKSDMLQSMESPRVWHDWATEQQQLVFFKFFLTLTSQLPVTPVLSQYRLNFPCSNHALKKKTVPVTWGPWKDPLSSQ